ncbi:DUF7520 family protein [Halobaculum sp. P14]|uniref:DUF7520 family protein n=1 Tax=Halobaculum sp. P14 TaxID=3421638 RepID=UPI003EBF701D
MTDFDDRRGADADGPAEATVEAGDDGARYFLVAGAVGTLFVAAAGYVVAANNAVAAVDVFGVVTLPGSPAAMAAYGATLSVLVLAVLFGLVSMASRVDDDAV